ncbi:hypothetical protein [Bradyrhizobium sp. AZCC 2230]|uniref:hypothetical protein n=1 Tax=Bradyrhizobium sp. AZCC 2230 TaxID=3117021 RepID=UPI002FF1C78E
MRRACRIVNEMEFRMWRAAKSFSPSARAGTMQRFQAMHHPAMAFATPAICSILAHLRLCTLRILESGAALKRHCPTHLQYG